MRQFHSFSKVLLFLITAASLGRAGTIILNFHGQPGFNKVTLKWTTQNEANLKGFEVERSIETPSKGSFKKVDFVKASTDLTDKKTYTFEDKSVFKQVSRTFYYRLKIIDTNDSYSYSKAVPVTPTISSARQTWGSIKAMFR